MAAIAAAVVYPKMTLGELKPIPSGPIDERYMRAPCRTDWRLSDGSSVSCHSAGQALFFRLYRDLVTSIACRSALPRNVVGMALTPLITPDTRVCADYTWDYLRKLLEVAPQTVSHKNGRPVYNQQKLIYLPKADKDMIRHLLKAPAAARKGHAGSFLSLVEVPVARITSLEAKVAYDDDRLLPLSSNDMFYRIMYAIT